MNTYQFATEILAGQLWLGGYLEADDIHWLHENHIGAIVACAKENSEPIYPQLFGEYDKGYLYLRLEDAPSYSDKNNISAKIKKATAFINTRINEGKTVYVHCLAGVNRSATVVISYLIQYQGMSFMDAIRFVELKRNIKLAGLHIDILTFQTCPVPLGRFLS